MIVRGPASLTFVSAALLAGFFFGPLDRLVAAASADSTASNVGRRLFERETFGGNGRTCRTCHSSETGTVSPDDAQNRFVINPKDPLFLADGSDDGQGNGVTRMLVDATILMKVLLPSNVTLDPPAARFITVRRGIPTTLNTPALDPVLMYDGRRPTLTSQAQGAILDHAQPKKLPSEKDLQRIAEFELTDPFFSSDALRTFARTGQAPSLPLGTNDAENRGRRFFEDVPLTADDPRPGSCAICHSGPMLNETNQFIPRAPFRRGGRFQSIRVSEINTANNPVFSFLFQNPDGTSTTVTSPDPGRALITGNATDDGENLNAFKTPTLWGVTRTAPYFHDNSAKTLEDVMRHYQAFFAGFTPAFELTQGDQSDIIAFMRLLQ
jgi:cytochrome c peroxidase